MALKSINGMYLTGSLFKERAELSTHMDHVRFSLHEDRPGLINARKAFVELEDPTGYKFAMRYLDGSYEQWMRLMDCLWFREAYQDWMDELNAKLKARAQDGIRKIAEDDSTPQAVKLAALKYLHSGEKPVKHRRGAPSKEEVRGELQNQVREAREVKEDMERIGIKVIQ